MDRDKLARRLMATFRAELGDHVHALNRDLLALESAAADAVPGLVQTLFRTAHSLKGAARSVGLGPIEATCHQLEEILTAARDGGATLTAEEFQVLFATADAIDAAARRLQASGDSAGAADLDGSPLTALLPQLQAVARAAREPRSGSFVSAAQAAPPAVPPPPPPPSLRPGPPPGEAAVRVSATKLDALVARSGELVVSQQRLELRGEELTALRETLTRLLADWRTAEPALRRPLEAGALPHRAAQVVARTPDILRRLEQDLDRFTVALTRDRRALGRVGSALDESARRARMLPFAEACQGLDRTVRDLCRATGKEAEVVVRGGAVELDRAVLEALRDPLLQLARNAVDHGIEPPAERRAAGKPARGRIAVTAALRGALVEVGVEDDGRGIDLGRVRQQCLLRGMDLPRAAGAREERELLRMVFLPGFSTAATVTEVSGRGVGLDVVSSRLAALHGSVDLDSHPGQGTRFALTVPLTLSALRVLLVVACGQTFAFVGTSVRTLRRVAADDLHTIEGREVLPFEGGHVPVTSLAAVLGIGARARLAAGSRALVVILATGASPGDRLAAFVVDDLLAEQEVMVKSLGTRLVRVRHVAGATILPSGRVALILNSADLVATALRDTAGRRSFPASSIAPATSDAPALRRRRLIVADDSVTTRTLIKSILEATGYDVTVAADGADAWRLLQEHGADLVVSDVEMPRMDGFGLTAAIRASKRFRELPVILVTALSSDQDRARGVEAGANAYLPKSSFDQGDLLEAIAHLL